jgi:ATP-dependent protease ClpP protease subunit
MEQKTPDLAEIEIFDEIDNFWGIGPADFKAKLDTVKGAASIKLLLNSPGGSVFDGMAIASMLAVHREKLDVEIVGIGASIASIIALAGRKLTMAKGSYFMIHNPLTFTAGDAADLRKTADIMDKMKGDFIDVYQAKSKKSRKDISDLMDAETWYSDKEAVAAGFADDIADYGQLVAHTDGKVAKQFAKIPKEIIMGKEGNTDSRKLEDDLRDAGYSKADALAIVADGWKAVGRSESVPTERSESAKLPVITPAMRIADMNSRIRTPTP